MRNRTPDALQQANGFARESGPCLVMEYLFILFFSFLRENRGVAVARSH